MPKRREENVRRVLPIGSENVRCRLDLEAGEGMSAQLDHPVRRPRVHCRVPASHPGSGLGLQLEKNKLGFFREKNTA